MQTIISIENALLAAITPTVQAAGAKTIHSFSGQKTLDNVRARMVPLPAVYSLYSGSQVQTEGHRRLEVMTFSVLVLATSLRTEDSQGRTGLSDAVYPLLDAVATALDGYDLGIAGLLPIIYKGRQPLDVSGALAVYAVELELRQAWLATNP